jgi:hypothetical protein
MPSRKATPQEKIKRAFRNKTGARLTFEDVKVFLDTQAGKEAIYGVEPEGYRAYYEDERHNPKAQSKPEAEQ